MQFVNKNDIYSKICYVVFGDVSSRASEMLMLNKIMNWMKHFIAPLICLDTCVKYVFGL